jgi:thioredoxin-like negative regulator of GroEL
LDPKTKEAMETFATARDTFKQGDYAQAQGQIEKAIGLTPGDSVMHEFRALDLFARKNYRESAAAIYAVLAVRPGWDWETMKSLYADMQTYTDQLRALEHVVKASPEDSAARFVLAYHYLVCQQPDAAANMLEQVVRLTPDNQLAAELLKVLKRPPDNGVPKAGGT